MQNRVLYPKNTIIFAFAAFIMLVSAVSLYAGQDDAAIDKVRVDFNAAYNEGNAKALAGLIDDEGIWMPPGEAALAGRKNIEARYTNFFAKVRSKFELKAGDIKLGNGWAFVSSTFTRTDTSKADGAVRRVTGNYMLVLKKQPDGAWKIVRDIWNETTKS